MKKYFVVLSVALVLGLLAGMLAFSTLLKVAMGTLLFELRRGGHSLIIAGVAQLAEQCSCKALVGGSIPPISLGMKGLDSP